MPEVTVWPKPNGLPIATTKSPTRNCSASAMGRLVRSSASMRNTATSVSLSEPTSSALTSRSSLSVTVMSSARAIKWWLVTTCPAAASRITPVPRPRRTRLRLRCPGKPKKCWKNGSRNRGPVRTTSSCAVEMFTTAGTVSSSMGASEGNSFPASHGNRASAGTASVMANRASAARHR